MTFLPGIVHIGHQCLQVFRKIHVRSQICNLVMCNVMYILVQSRITHAQSHLISYLMEILYNGHHCHWQCNGYRLYSHRKYTNSVVTKVKGEMQFQDHCTCFNLFSESPLSFQFQYLYYCSIIEHCTVNKVCIEFPKKSRTEH